MYCWELFTSFFFSITIWNDSMRGDGSKIYSHPDISLKLNSVDGNILWLRPSWSICVYILFTMKLNAKFIWFVREMVLFHWSIIKIGDPDVCWCCVRKSSCGILILDQANIDETLRLSPFEKSHMHIMTYVVEKVLSKRSSDKRSNFNSNPRFICFVFAFPMNSELIGWIFIDSNTHRHRHVDNRV